MNKVAVLKMTQRVQRCRCKWDGGGLQDHAIEKYHRIINQLVREEGPDQSIEHHGTQRDLYLAETSVWRKHRCSHTTATSCTPSVPSPLFSWAFPPKHHEHMPKNHLVHTTLGNSKQPKRRAEVRVMKVAVIDDVGTVRAKETSNLILIDATGPFPAIRMIGKFASISLTNPPLHYGPFGLNGIPGVAIRVHNLAGAVVNDLVLEGHVATASRRRRHSGFPLVWHQDILIDAEAPSSVDSRASPCGSWVCHPGRRPGA